MNATRRKIINKQYYELQAIASAIEELKSQAQEILSELESVRDDEQEAYDNMSPNLQGSERGQVCEEAVSNLETAISALEELDEIDFTDALQALDDAEHG